VPTGVSSSTFLTPAKSSLRCSERRTTYTVSNHLYSKLWSSELTLNVFRQNTHERSRPAHIGGTVGSLLITSYARTAKIAGCGVLFYFQ
jgi:hypothetical protein